MKTMTAAALLIALSAATPALADDQGNANAEQQTQPVPNRGGTAGGPAHDAGRAPAASGTVRNTQDFDASAKHGNSNFPERPESQHNHGSTSGGTRN